MIFFSLQFRWNCLCVQSGIQQVDSHVPVRQRTMTVFGMKTVKELVQPWKVVISDVASPGDLMVTSKAPSQESLDQWFQQCLQNVRRVFALHQK